MLTADQISSWNTLRDPHRSAGGVQMGQTEKFLAPTGAQGVKMCVRPSVRPCDIMLTSTLGPNEIV